VKRIYLSLASFVFVLAGSDVCSAAEMITITIKSLTFDPKQVGACWSALDRACANYQSCR
jgi:hypothetical protein